VGSGRVGLRAVLYRGLAATPWRCPNTCVFCAALVNGLRRRWFLHINTDDARNSRGKIHNHGYSEVRESRSPDTLDFECTVVKCCKALHGLLIAHHRSRSVVCQSKSLIQSAMSVSGSREHSRPDGVSITKDYGIANRITRARRHLCAGPTGVSG
jgi:hypothetical protein